MAPDDLNLSELFSALRRSWLLVLAMVAAGMALAIGAAFLIRPVYRAQIILTPAQADANDGLMGLASQVGDLAALVGIGGSLGRSNAAVNLAYLQSRGFAETFILKHNLLPILFAKRWDARNARWRSPRPGEIPSYQDGVARFVGKVRRINEDRKTGLITLSIEWTDPDTAARWANSMVADLNGEMRARATSEAEQSIGLLNNELASTQVVELRQTINRLIENQIKASVLARVRTEFAFQVVDAARPPDLNKPAWPNMVVFGCAGLSAGILAGTLLALGRQRRARGEHR